MPVTEVDKTIQKLIDDMADTLYSTTGVGLAAPQVGSNKSVIIYDTYREEGKRNFKALINPRIVSHEGEITSEEEGCKSLPGLRVDVRRAATIKVEAIDREGNHTQVNAAGFEAIVLQHEIDHLNGLLSIDHVTASERDLYRWYAVDLANIFGRIQWLNKKPDGVIYQRRTATQNTIILKDGTQVQLYFASPEANARELRLSGIMSRIDLNDPLVLLGVYTQAMMLSLAWKSDPKRVYMLGFGGGRIPMIFYHYFPAAVIDGAEIDPNVVDLSKKYFGIEMDERLRVAVKDGRQYLANLPRNMRYDIILIDCYTGIGNHPYRLSTIEFYELCKSHLIDGGVVATNLLESDPLYDKKVKTFLRSFKNTYDFAYEDAHVLFGSDADRIPEADFIARAESIDKQCKFRFPFLERAYTVTALKPHLSIGDIFFNNHDLLADDSPPPEVGKRLLKEDPIFRGVGRNDPCPCGSGRKFKKCHGMNM